MEVIGRVETRRAGWGAAALWVIAIVFFVILIRDL